MDAGDASGGPIESLRLTIEPSKLHESSISSESSGARAAGQSDSSGARIFLKILSIKSVRADMIVLCNT